MKEDDMRVIGRLIAEVIRQPEDEAVRTRVRAEVAALTAKFPLYTHRAVGRSTDAIAG
jgi:glycine hydroxymethyltransferase